MKRFNLTYKQFNIYAIGSALFVLATFLLALRDESKNYVELPIFLAVLIGSLLNMCFCAWLSAQVPSKNSIKQTDKK